MPRKIKVNILFLSFSFIVLFSCDGPDYDILILHGTIYDGSGNAPIETNITIFNPETIIDKTTFEKLRQYPEGVDYVIVNGIFDVDQGEFQDVRSGTVLRKNRYNKL